MGTATPKIIINTHSKKKKQPKHNTKNGHQATREEKKRRREETRPIKRNPNQLRKWHQKHAYQQLT